MSFFIQQTPPKEEEITPGVTTPTPTSSTDTNHRILTTPPSTGRVQAVTSRRGSLKGRRLDLQVCKSKFFLKIKIILSFIWLIFFSFFRVKVR